MTEDKLREIARDLRGEDVCDDHLPAKVGPVRDHLLRIIDALLDDDTPERPKPGSVVEWKLSHWHEWLIGRVSESGDTVHDRVSGTTYYLEEVVWRVLPSRADILEEVDSVLARTPWNVDGCAHLSQWIGRELAKERQQ